jgi:biopolymer transport protein ExbB/biopolymer transport protein TolQ
MSFDLETLFGSMGEVAWGTVITLTLMSIYSIGVMIERQYAYSKARQQSRLFVPTVTRCLQQGKIEDALAASRDVEFGQSHLARVLGVGIREWQRRREAGGDGGDGEAAVEGARRAVQRVTMVSLAEMRRGLGALATIGSTAPFVGLFGTPFGIINAFASMALTGAGGIATVSAGIAEALVTTAYGLFVAVPAVWAYNYFSGHVEGFSVEMESSSSELLDYLLEHS